MYNRKDLITDQGCCVVEEENQEVNAWTSRKTAEEWQTRGGIMQIRPRLGLLFIGDKNRTSPLETDKYRAKWRLDSEHQYSSINKDV